MATAQERPGSTRRGREREPSVLASAEPTAGLPGTAGGEELGAEDERALDAGPECVGEPVAPRAPAASAGGSASSSSGPCRGPDQAQRVRRTFEDAGTGPENPNDWSHFDINNVVKSLRIGTVAVRRRALRKLHIRWWHASKAAMTKLLERAGVPQYTLKIIPSIIDTCRCCRMWTTPYPQSITSAELSDKFNEQVECDLLFIRKVIIFHLICRCTRWYAAVIVPDKTAESLMEALHTAWVSIHGPMRESIMDG